MCAQWLNCQLLKSGCGVYSSTVSIGLEGRSDHKEVR